MTLETCEVTAWLRQKPGGDPIDDNAIVAVGTQMEVDPDDGSGWLHVLASTIDGKRQAGFVDARCVQPPTSPAPAPAGNPSGSQQPKPQEPGGSFGSGPNLPAGFAEWLGLMKIKKASDINDFFETKGGAPFNEWFNKNVAGRESWAKGHISENSDVDTAFSLFWDKYASMIDTSMLDAIAYMSIFINEIQGRLVSITEEFGRPPAHPGISYLFDAIPGLKVSYNKAPGLNKSALVCFNNPDYNAQHGALAGNQLKNSQDPVWAGSVFPLSSVSTRADATKIGYILEADFFKFRGRGLIQTTWRLNYVELVKYIMSTPSHPLLAQFATDWKARNLTFDQICTVTTSQQWDDIFGKTDNEIVCVAIRNHAEKGHYMPISTNTDVANGAGPGSLVKMGTSISGSSAYGALFKSRVFQIVEALGSP